MAIPWCRTTLLRLVIIMFIGGSCSQPPLSTDDKSRALAAMDHAGANRHELQQVIDYYQYQDVDSEKLAAAHFLIANMSGHKSIVPRGLAAYKAAFTRIGLLRQNPIMAGRLDSLIRSELDSVIGNASLRPVTKPDLRQMPHELLIAYIDSAFSAWNKAPWKDRYTQKEFFEWVLPYRTSSEELENWHTKARKINIKHEDSILRSGNAYDLAVLLINHTGMEYGTDALRYPMDFSFGDLQSVGQGACFELADYATKLFRSRGIPAATDVIPTWGNRYAGHAWNVVILPGDSCRGIGYHPQGWLQLENRVPKIYRKRFSVMLSDPLYRYYDKEILPPFFEGMDMEDVTAQYDMPVSDISLQQLDPGAHKIIWLNCFNNRDWIPVAYAEVVNGEAVFQHVGRGLLFGSNRPVMYEDGEVGIVYLPAYYKSGRLTPASDPILLHADGNTETLRPTTDTQTVVLFRKYPKYPSFIYSEQSLIGGCIEGANQADFSDARTLYRITEIQRNCYEKYPVDTLGHFRYLRYRGHEEKNSQLAELKFYNGENLLTGTTLGSLRDGLNPEVVFDQNPLSYCELSGADHDWVGLDLGCQYPVTDVAYRSRTDDNDICPGDTYEMWYWQDGWRSLGRHEATGHSVSWSGVPCGALYFVRDLSKGREQRIFTYSKGQITWW